MSRTILTATFFVCLVAPTTALAGEKIDICRFDANTNTYSLVNIPAHAAHGDPAPGDSVPGMEGYEFGPSCEIESVIWCPTEGTLTETLGSHYFWFWVNGVAHGYTGTSETWTWFINWGALWGYFYGGDYLEFCTDADCSAPYSCYVPQ